MRKLLGGAVLALGVGGLGFYANNNHAERMQTRITGEASVIAMSSVHGVNTSVAGRDIRVSGIANSAVERDNLFAALDAIDGRRVVIDDLVVLEKASPFVFQSSKNADGQTYAGLVPSETVRNAFGPELKGAEAALELKAGVPDDQWDDMVLQALSSMVWLKEGEMSLTDRALVVTGKAETPPEKNSAEAILAELPEGYSADVNITSILPMAAPFTMASMKTTDGQTYSGVVQSEDGRAILQAAMGDEAANLVHSYGAPDSEWESVGAKGLAALAMLEQGEMSLNDQVLTVTGLAAIPPHKTKAEALLAELPEGYTANVDIKSMLDAVAPFKLSSIKTGDNQSYKGVVQSQVGRETLRAYMGDAADGLKHAYGAPDDAWETVAGKGLAALATLDDGEMTLKDQTLTITGLAANPPAKEAAENMVSALPDGYSANVNITSLLDTVTPFEIGSVKTASNQAYAGVIPSADARADLSAYTGVNGAKNLKLAYGAPDGNWVGVAGQGLAALDALEDGKMSLVDRVLIVEGRGATPVEKAQAEALVAQLPEGYSVTTDITAILQISSPYTLRSVKSGTMQTYSGDIPSEEDRAELAKHSATGVDTLMLSAGVPDDAWTGVAGQGLDALSNLDDGKLEISDRAVTLVGFAQTPVERDAALAALANLPDGYAVVSDITMLDDGSPAAYSIMYHPITGAKVEGKLPKGMSTEAIASALGLGSVSGTPTVGRIGNTDAADALSKRLNVMADWLPDFESFSLASDGTNTTVTSEVSAGVDDTQVQTAIAKAMGKSTKVNVSGSEIAVDTGTVRETVLGDKQVFSGGFWLPVQAQFEVSVESCLKASDDILSASKVNFVTGSAKLDAKSVRTVNSIAAIMSQCLDNSGLNAEIGGHTDSSGSHAFNVKLSQSRAQTVMDELIARGIPTDLIVAKGFGPDVPIASNDTDEGKAANRRTTIRWYVPVVETAPETTQSSTDADTAPTTQVSE